MTLLVRGEEGPYLAIAENVEDCRDVVRVLFVLFVLDLLLGEDGVDALLDRRFPRLMFVVPILFDFGSIYLVLHSFSIPKVYIKLAG